VRDLNEALRQAVGNIPRKRSRDLLAEISIILSLTSKSLNLLEGSENSVLAETRRS
jgi:hypothetical protein